VLLMGVVYFFAVGRQMLAEWRLEHPKKQVQVAREGDPRIVLYVLSSNEFELLIESLGEQDRNVYVRLGYKGDGDITDVKFDSPERIHYFSKGKIRTPFGPAMELEVPELLPHEKRSVRFRVDGKLTDIGLDASSQRCGQHCKNIIIEDPKTFWTVAPVIKAKPQ
jgi:hypothetical protein